MDYYSGLNHSNKYPFRNSSEDEVILFWKRLRELPPSERVILEEELSKKLVSSIYHQKDHP